MQRRFHATQGAADIDRMGIPEQKIDAGVLQIIGTINTNGSAASSAPSPISGW
jgi:hypothetical protein